VVKGQRTRDLVCLIGVQSAYLVLLLGGYLRQTIPTGTLPLRLIVTIVLSETASVLSGQFVRSRGVLPLLVGLLVLLALRILVGRPRRVLVQALQA